MSLHIAKLRACRPLNRQNCIDLTVSGHYNGYSPFLHVRLAYAYSYIAKMLYKDNFGKDINRNSIRSLSSLIIVVAIVSAVWSVRIMDMDQTSVELTLTRLWVPCRTTPGKSEHTYRDHVPWKQFGHLRLFLVFMFRLHPRDNVRRSFVWS